MTKRIELLSELVPSVTVMALLVNPNASDSIIQPLIRDTQDAVHGRGVQFQVLKAGTENEIDVAFASLAHFKVGALLVSPDGYFPTRREQLAALASRHAVPVM